MPKILAIDDKKDNLTTLTALLKALIPDCDVITALSGPEGLDKATAHPPDIILLDIKMPGMDGYEVCKRLKENENTRHIPVIMLSAVKTESVDLVKGLETGADAYLAKPIDEYVLTAQVKTALRIKEVEDRLRQQNEQMETLVEERTETLRASEKRLRAVLDASPTGIGMVADRKLGWANDAMYRIVGYEPGSLTGKSARILYADDEAFEHAGRLLYADAIESGIGQVETQWVRKDGTYFDCILRLRLLDPSDPEKGQIVAVTDISQLKRAHRELSDSEQKFRGLFESLIDGVVEGDLNGKIITCNRAFRKRLGYSDKEIKELTYHDLTPDNWREVDAIHVKQALERGYSDPYEKEHRRKDGTTYPISIRIWSKKDAKGRPVGLWGIIRDISERVQAEEERNKLEAQLRRAQKMEAISTLAGGIAHDFNNILSAIVGYSQLAQMKLDRENEAYADLDQVSRSADRAKKLIQQILAVGRRQEQATQPMQLKYVVKEAIKFLHASLPSTIEIREEYDQDIGLIDADPTQMHQVLMNLCTNAGHAMEEDGGTLTVNLENAEIRAGNAELNLKPGTYLKLTVNDTGHGMTSEVMEKIFDPYFTTKEPGQGTGIGLSVVHGIITQYGGAITAESQPGKGTTFHVYLPIIQAEKQRPAKATETSLPTGYERILFIDDEEILSVMGKKMLEPLGYKVTTLASSTEALTIFREDPAQFDLVITDTTMPHMTGDILAQEMMKIRPDIPIVICTGHSKRMSEQKAKEMGLKAFLQKPLNIEDLSQTVRAVLDES